VDHPEFADTQPTSNPAAADLLVSHDGDKHAEALASFSIGQLAEDNSDTDEALAAYQKAFDLDSTNVQLAVKIAYMDEQRNDAPAGIQVLKDAVKAAPKEPLPLIWLSRIYVKYLKKNDSALKYAEQALALDPNYYPSYLELYELQSAAGPEKVTQLLQRAAKATSTDAQFWLQIGSLYTQTYLKEDGTASSPDALRQTSSIFQKAAELGQGDAVVLAKVGNYFVDSRQVKEAIPYYLTALRLKQDSDDPVLANIGEKLARALNESGQRDKAIEILEQITQAESLRFETFELLGELYKDKADEEQTHGEVDKAKGDEDKALANYKHSVLIDASEPRNHIHVAEMQMRMQRYDEAVETAKSARARFPDNPETIYLLALTLSQAKKHAEAMVAFGEALTEFENGHEDLLNAQFYFSYGAAAEQAGSVDKAVELLRKSIELDPSAAAQAYNYLGYMWVERSVHLDEAGELIRKALEMEPDNGAYLDSFGWYYFKKGEYETALQHLLKAAEAIKPEDAVVFEHIGDTYDQLGKAAQALQYWQKAQALDQGNKQIVSKIDSAKQKMSSNKVPPTVEKIESAKAMP
jgi:tetratricopeptide (TPR) repeat protein